MSSTRRNANKVAESIALSEKQVVTPKKVRPTKAATITPSISEQSSIEEEDNSSPVRAVKLSTESTPEKKGSNRQITVTPSKPTSIDDKFRHEKSSPAQSQIIITPQVDTVYRIVQKCTGALGGNGYDGAIYGELTKHSMQKAINVLVDHCGMSAKSRFIDVGSGLGKPNFHASQSPGVRLSVGIELEEIRWQLAIHNLKGVIPEINDTTLPPRPEEAGDDNGIRLNGGLNFMVGDIDNAATFDPFTHVYMFDLGFPPPLQGSIARKFNSSVYARYLVSYRPPHRVIHEYGYAVDFIMQIATSMFGSGESHTAYFYKRNNEPAMSTPTMQRLVIPGRHGLVGEDGTIYDEGEENVVCDPYFLSSCQLAVGRLSLLEEHCNQLCDTHMQSARPKRERKAPKRLGKDE